MPHDHRTSKADFPLDEARRLRQQGQSYYKIAEAIGWSMPQTRRYLRGEVTVNSNLPAIPASQSIATPSQHIAMASQPIATELDDIKSRVATLEAFMAVVQSEHRSLSQPIAISSQPIAVHRSEPPTWVSRGVQLASDMVQAIDAYAAKHRLEKREALDELLRIAFAQVAEEVHNA